MITFLFNIKYCLTQEILGIPFEIRKWNVQKRKMIKIVLSVICRLLLNLPDSANAPGYTKSLRQRLRIIAKQQTGFL